MKEKKTAVITIRTTERTKDLLEKEAELRDWTLSQLAERILTAYAEKGSGQQINFISNQISNITIGGKE